MTFEIEIREGDRDVWTRELPGGQNDPGGDAIFETIQQLHKLVPDLSDDVGDRFTQWLKTHSRRLETDGQKDWDFPFGEVLQFEDVEGYTVTIRHDR